MFYVLSQRSEDSITQIAEAIGTPHPVVSQIVKEMTRAGLTTSTRSASDARVNLVRLSDAGQRLVPRLERQCEDVSEAVDGLLTEMQYDFWKAMEEMEFLLAQKDFLARVSEVRKARESQRVEIIDCAPQFHEDFRRLNYEWIERYFTVEGTDRRYLEHPEETILAPGGHIVMARYEGRVVGTCALIKKDDDTYELAKMAVAESARGRGIGRLLGQAVIQRAKAQGGKSVVLESNTILQPAINLYRKLGFQKLTGPPSPYARCNIQMELDLDTVSDGPPM